MAFNQNPLQWKSVDPAKPNHVKTMIGQLSDLCSSFISLFTQLTDPVFLSGLFNGGNLLLASALSNSLTDLGSPAGNSTIDTKQAVLVAARVSWTTAANWTLTLNNLALGAIVYFRLVNNSGLARTFTISPLTPASAAYTVQVFLTSSTVATPSAGVSIASGGSITAIGITYTAAAIPVIQMIGYAA